MSKYMRNIRKYIKEYYKSIIHVDKLFDIFDTIPCYVEPKNAIPYIPKTGEISLQHISFSYGEKAIFTNFSLNIKG